MEKMKEFETQFHKEIKDLQEKKANKESVIQALSKKSQKTTVEQIAKEVSDVVVSLDQGFHKITESVNKRLCELELKLRESLTSDVKEWQRRSQESLFKKLKSVDCIMAAQSSS